MKPPSPDGLGKYTDPEVLRREKVREESIVQLGFTVFRWTWRDAYRRPDALAHRALEIPVHPTKRGERSWWNEWDGWNRAPSGGG